MSYGNAVLNDAAARSTIRLHELAREYLKFRQGASDHLCELQDYSDKYQAAILALQHDESLLRQHLSNLQQVHGLMQQVSMENSNVIEAHEQALECQNPDHNRILELKAEVLVEDDVLDLLARRQGEGGFDSTGEELIKASMDAARRQFVAKYLLHEMQKKLNLPLEGASSGGPPPKVLSATASSSAKPAPPVPKRLPPKAALKASFPQASDKMIEKVLVSCKNDMAAARRKLKELCPE